MLTVTVIVPGAAAGLFQLALEPFCVAVTTEDVRPDWRVVGYAEEAPDTEALERALAVAAAGGGNSPPAPAGAAPPATPLRPRHPQIFPPGRVRRLFLPPPPPQRPPAGRPPPRPPPTPPSP